MPMPLFSRRHRRWCRLPWVLVWMALLNFSLLLYFMLRHGIHSNKPSDISHSIADEVTFVFREFEDFENELAESVTKLHTALPSAAIVVVADALPYPPVELPKGVELVVLNPSPTQNLRSSRPESYIQTHYTVILPDAVVLSEAEGIARIINDLESQQTASDNKVKATVWPVDTHAHLHCVNLDVNYKQWTATYSHTRDKLCDSVTGGRHVIAVKTSDLFELSDPFLRPVPEMFFMQTALRGWKIGVGNRTVFASTQELFRDAHASWKHRTHEQGAARTGFSRLGLKLVTSRDGAEAWYGACSKTSARCFGTIHGDVPEYVRRGQWTPPCCLRALRTTARHVFRVLGGAGVRYWLEGGSLLGAARDSDIIPWDYDVDIGIYRADITKSFHLSSAQSGKFEDEDGFVWEKATEGEFYRVQYSATNHLHVDIFPFYPKDGNMTKDDWMKTHRQDMPFPEKYLLPMEKLSFVGQQVNVPNNHREFLELKFGKGVIGNPRYPNDKPVL